MSHSIRACSTWHMVVRQGHLAGIDTWSYRVDNVNRVPSRNDIFTRAVCGRNFGDNTWRLDIWEGEVLAGTTSNSSYQPVLIKRAIEALFSSPSSSVGVMGVSENRNTAVGWLISLEELCIGLYSARRHSCDTTTAAMAQLHRSVVSIQP